MSVSTSSSPSAVAAPLLCVRGLTKSYALGQEAVPVLDGLDLAVAGGEMVAIMGPSGSGKTTLLNCISAIDAPDAGEVLIDERAIDYGSETARTVVRRERIGIIFQFFNLIPTLTAAENVALPFLIGGRMSAAVRERVDTLLDAVGMAKRRAHYPHQLSGGEMQLVSIARALARRPSLLLADEPSGNVNPQIGRRIMEILRDQAGEQGAAVLVVTHSPEHAAFADRVCFLGRGRILAGLEQGGRAQAPEDIHRQLLALGI